MTVLGCGPSGADWDGKGFCIGVNDCLKFGKPVSALVCVNWKFEVPREKIIRETVAPEGFYSQSDYWCHQPYFKQIHTDYFKVYKPYDLKKIYHSRTSPFIAISLAAYLGHKEIVIYGVDFDDHPIIKDDALEFEISQYLNLIRFLEKEGIKVYLGVAKGCFKDLIPTK